MAINTLAREGIHVANPVKMSPLMMARSAGFLYLVITIAAIVAHFYMPSQVIVPDDAAATADNIRASESLFRFGGIGSEMIVLVSETALSIILYILLKPVNNMLSLLAATFRLIMTAIHGINLLNYFFVLLVLSDAAFLSVFDAGQINSLVGLFLDAHHYGFTIGIAFLTPHVFILGYLIYKSGYIPRILGVLFVIAAFGYLIDGVGILFFADYESPEFLAMPIAIAEIAFPLWLLVKGVNADQWKKRALESA